MVAALFAALILLFYAVPLFSSDATIQWDAADAHYSAQKYFSDQIWSGKLPFWTPYVFSGMPFLADMQTGAWYPLNWPFFLAGVTPGAIQWELALHAFLACMGAFLLARELLGNGRAAVLAGLLYGLGGYFAAHSSHVGMFQTAALFPWILWLFTRAVEKNPWLYGGVGAIAAGSLVLAGHFQTALYSFTGVALFAAARIALRESGWARRGPLVLAGIVCGAVLIAAIQVLPGLELTARSIRSAADFSKETNASLTPGSLLTLAIPDFYGAVTGDYKGPGDITQFYFYQGLIVPLLAGFALVRSKLRWPMLALAVPAIWYALGPPGGLYRVIALLPGFRSVRAPVHIWFVAALALAILAAAGAQELNTKWRKSWLVAALIGIGFADLWYWNMNRNALAYGRMSYQERYGAMAVNFARATAPLRSNPLHRLWFEQDSNSFGPMNGSLNTRTEVTYGYNPLALQQYLEYTAAAQSNPRLLDGLAVTHRLEANSGQFQANPTALTRVSIPSTVVRIGSREQAKARLSGLNPASEAIVDSSALAFEHSAQGRAEITAYSGDRYQIRYSAAGTALLRIAVPYFPGWIATVDGAGVPVIPVDYALSGVVVPAGNHEMVFRYRSNWFAVGAVVSALALLAASVAVWRGRAA